jgi:hypothetical protein
MRIGILRTKLIAAYALIVAITYLIFLLSSGFLPWTVLFVLTLPFSIVAGLVSAGLSHSGYYFSPDKGFLGAAIVNCFCLYFLSKRFQLRKSERGRGGGGSRSW